MYRVVIIDDEPIIIQGIRQMISWEEYRCEVVGTANDGSEGSRLIRKWKPHIVITDISMPELDGLSMVAGLKSEFPKMQIIILTGFDDFSYARDAIHLGVLRYLLKPSNLDEIKEALSTATAHLDTIWDTGAEEGSGEKKDDDPERGDASSFIVKKALEYIQEHYQEKLTLEEVAQRVYVSQWHLSKLLNKQRGENFSQILNGIRIKAAMELLKDPEYRVGTIAECVGFGDAAHFSRVFKRTIGVSAVEYRNRIIGKE